MTPEMEEQIPKITAAADFIATVIRGRGFVATVAPMGPVGRQVFVSRDGMPWGRQCSMSCSVELHPASRRYLHSGYVKEARIVVSPYWTLKQRPLRLTNFTPENYVKAADKAIACFLLQEGAVRLELAASAAREERLKQESGLSDFITRRGSAIPKGFLFRASGDRFILAITPATTDLVGPWTPEEALSLCNMVRVFAGCVAAQRKNFRPESGASLAQREDADAKPA